MEPLSHHSSLRSPLPGGKGTSRSRECWTSRENPENPELTEDAPIHILTLQHPLSPRGAGTPLPIFPPIPTTQCHMSPSHTHVPVQRAGSPEDHRLLASRADQANPSLAAPGANRLPRGLNPALTACFQEESHRTGFRQGQILYHCRDSRVGNQHLMWPHAHAGTG